MKKAFLFDMDGVLADTETMWDKLGYDDMIKAHFGEELFKNVQIKSGVSIKSIFDAFVTAGWKGEYEPFLALNEAMAIKIYPMVPLTNGVDDLITSLSEQGYLIGVVSGSPREWIEMLISRLPNRDKISLVLSVNVHKTLKPKPSPDPYIYAMTELGVGASNTIILEDSKTGVTAGKASGAKVICFTAHHHGYTWQPRAENADFYAGSMSEVGDIVAKIGLG